MYEVELGHHTNTIYALHKLYVFLGYIPKTLKIPFGLRGKLFEHRIINGYTYNDVAQKIELDKGTISRFEQGKIITKDTQDKISSYFLEIDN